MPRYYFDVRDGSEFSRDPEGEELSDTGAARAEAIRAGREMLGERLLHGGSLNHRQIEIADETGHVVEVVRIQDVLLRHGELRSYPDDVTHSAPVANARNAPSR